jgi:hypothetical protein
MEQESRYPAPVRSGLAIPDRIKVAGVKALGVELLPLGVDYLEWRAGRGPEPEVRIVPEPANPVDPNAIRVEWWNRRGVEWLVLGYVPAKLAANMKADDYRVHLAEVLFHAGRRETGWPSGVRIGLEPREGF